MERDQRLSDLPSITEGKKCRSNDSVKGMVVRNAFLFVVVALLAGATSITRDVYLKRFTKIESMSIEERGRLERNFEQFRKLTPFARSRT